MEENLRTRILIILCILCVIFFVGMIFSCSNAARVKSLREEEMVKRLDAQESMAKLLQEKKILEEKLEAKDKSLEEEKAANEATKKSLQQELLVNESLKDELAKVSKINEALEQESKEASASGQSKTKK